jgi:hypothetical protein
MSQEARPKGFVRPCDEKPKSELALSLEAQMFKTPADKAN